MKKMIWLSGAMIVALFAAALFLTGCDANTLGGTRGSGNVTSEKRDVSGYHEIDLSGIGTLVIDQNGNEGLTIEGEDNVISKIRTAVNNGRLDIGVEPGMGINPTRPIKYTVSVKNLDYLELSGSGDVQAASLKADNLTYKLSGSGSADLKSMQLNGLNATLSGSGSITFAGKTNTQDVVISGSGSYKASDLQSKEANVRVSGSGSATVRVSDKLNADVSGSGSITYYGNPGNVQQSKSGSGSINKAGD